MEADFFHTAIRSRVYVLAFTRASDGVRIGQWDLAEARMREIQFLVPPLSEQAAIVRFLDKATAKINDGVARAQSEFDLLHEYRTRLIADVVTGKLDVREAAAGLPEVDPLTADDYVDDRFDANAASKIDELDTKLEEAEA